VCTIGIHVGAIAISYIMHYNVGVRRIARKTPKTDLRPATRRTLTQHVYDELAAAISSGRLPPGEKLVIDALARDFNVSITPVREALMRLKREGLVLEVPYSGVYVSKLDLDELRELFLLRGVLEGYGAHLAVEHVTEADLAALRRQYEDLDRAATRGDVAAFREGNLRFHALMLAPAPGRALQDVITLLVRNTERYRAIGDRHLDRTYLEAASADHRRVMAAFEARRGEEVETLARAHALTFVTHLERCLRTEGAGGQAVPASASPDAPAV